METHQSVVDLLRDITVLRRKLQEGRPLTPDEQKSLLAELNALLLDVAANARRGPLA